MSMTDVAAVIVHHRRPNVVVETVHSIVRAGVKAHNVLVVDNSERDDITRMLKGATRGWRVLFTANRGYGAAVNLGIRSMGPSSVYTLVLTHEARCHQGDLQLMVSILDANPDVAVVGPDTLRQGDQLWSRGGFLSPHLLIPRHRMEEGSSTGLCTDVDWLDGAIALYRTAVLAEQPFREDFFLYLEETELHTRLRAHGWRVVTATGSTAEQTSSGMPAYWAARNTVLFQAAHGTLISRTFAPWYVMMRTCAQALICRRPGQLPQAVKGLLAGMAAVTRSPEADHRPL